MGPTPPLPVDRGGRLLSHLTQQCRTGAEELQGDAGNKDNTARGSEKLGYICKKLFAKGAFVDEYSVLTCS